MTWTIPWDSPRLRNRVQNKSEAIGNTKTIHALSVRDPNVLPLPTKPKKSRSLWAWLPGSTLEAPTIGTRIVGDTSVLTGYPSYQPRELPLLPCQSHPDEGRITLILDLEETLVHVTQLEEFSHGADFSFSLQVRETCEKFYVKTRPGVDAFLRTVAEWYEVVVFSGAGYAYVEEIMNRLDPNGFVAHRLYKEHCTRFSSYIVKDLSLLGRDLRRVIIIDNCESCYAFQPENAIRIPTWISREDDRELEKMLPILERSRSLQDVRNSHVEV